MANHWLFFLAFERERALVTVILGQYQWYYGLNALDNLKRDYVSIQESIKILNVV